MVKLDTNTFQLTFLGDIEKDSEIYKITYEYVRNIDFYENKNPILNNEFSKHSHLILVG